MKNLRDEISQMELERQEWEDPTENDRGIISREVIEPNKLTNNFEEIQRQRQQLLEQEIRLAKMQAMETELIQLQVFFLTQSSLYYMSKDAWNDENSDDDEEPLVKPIEKTILNPGKLDKEQLQFDKVSPD